MRIYRKGNVGQSEESKMFNHLFYIQDQYVIIENSYYLTSFRDK